MELVRSQPLMYSPGATRQYSNSGFAVLGAVIEAVTGQAYHDDVRELVFRPAGMQSTGPRRDASSATGYTRGDGRVTATTDRWPPVASPAGGSHATAGDLHAFVSALMSDRLLDSRSTDCLLQGRRRRRMSSLPCRPRARPYMLIAVQAVLSHVERGLNHADAGVAGMPAVRGSPDRPRRDACLSSSRQSS
jgi:CubicO group peptidase (beta-lactamase class C family)